MNSCVNNKVNLIQKILHVFLKALFKHVKVSHGDIMLLLKIWYE